MEYDATLLEILDGIDISGRPDIYLEQFRQADPKHAYSHVMHYAVSKICNSGLYGYFAFT